MIKSKSCSGYFLSPKVVPLKKFFIRVGAPEVKHLLLLLLNRHWSRDHKSKREKNILPTTFIPVKIIHFIHLSEDHSFSCIRTIGEEQRGQVATVPKILFFSPNDVRSEIMNERKRWFEEEEDDDDLKISFNWSPTRCIVFSLFLDVVNVVNIVNIVNEVKESIILVQFEILSQCRMNSSDTILSFPRSN